MVIGISIILFHFLRQLADYLLAFALPSSLDVCDKNMCNKKPLRYYIETACFYFLPKKVSQPGQVCPLLR